MNVLAYLGQKDKPFTCIDTHAGAGIYDLDGEWALKTGEAKEGIERLVDRDDVPAFFAPYVSLCATMLENGKRYPGSPEIERRMCRESDSIILMELHNTEIEILRANLGGEGRVHIHHRDGFSGLAALCPPEPRRGLALIDPSYETPDDYAKAAGAVISTHRKWPVGTLMLWYPILNRRASELFALKDRFSCANIPGTLNIELMVGKSDDEGFGLAGSGLMIVQPPWHLAEEAEAALPWLAGVLAPKGMGDTGSADGANSAGGSAVTWITPPAGEA
jgi:23S rRNA (adenine2030-N6)-methyltransferase